MTAIYGPQYLFPKIVNTALEWKSSRGRLIITYALVPQTEADDT
jgi:hypothetical protein